MPGLSTDVAGVDRSRGPRIWHIDAIYTEIGQVGKYCPNVGDYVYGWENGWERVTDADYSTGLSTRETRSTPIENGVDPNDVLIGVVGVNQSESYRIYVDNSVIPHSMNFDATLYLYPVDAEYIKVFRGYDISEATGHVISARYGENDVFIDDQVALVDVITPTPAGQTVVKTPAGTHCMEDIINGEPLTAVVYGASGKVLSISRLLAYDTSFVKGGEDAIRTINGISLISPFISPTEPDVLQVPSNTPIDSIYLMAQLSYTDGSPRRLNIDGSKTTLWGLEDAISSVPTREKPLVLRYLLSSDERALDSGGIESNSIARAYTLRTIPADGAYSVKLFIIPTWDDSTTGYRLLYYLFNLNRAMLYDVTDYVQLNTGSASYNPGLMGTQQNFEVVVDMAAVDPTLAPYRHIQAITMTLVSVPSEGRTPWIINYEPDTIHGEGLEADMVYQDIGNWELDISCGATVFSDWLNRLYLTTFPLFDPDTESGPIQPTHFQVVLNSSVQQEYEIGSWDQKLMFASGGVDRQSIIIVWIYRTEGNDLYLGATGLINRHNTVEADTRQ